MDDDVHQPRPACGRIERCAQVIEGPAWTVFALHLEVPRAFVVAQVQAAWAGGVSRGMLHIGEFGGLEGPPKSGVFRILQSPARPQDGSRRRGTLEAAT